ncbi:N-acetylglucosamine kinase [Alicyclobacillus sp. SO9]|uniref:N-acetylglucosamine kinase n=1 Tax=Alicyclobacillus sp. SO9 TaxID=2665646 RepID=UPI0018E8244C|nr:BadF/BadG/BcrA/BcrD ATPase family protein [Alicyclobacillus sp. SO9]QQE79182.1 hypothetical protein GI364_01295 [Alicyclobacillus sp. SO9]
MELYIGVDGGGTKTEVTLYNPDGQTAVVITGRASNPNTVGIDNAVSVVMSLVCRALAEIERVPAGGNRTEAAECKGEHQPHPVSLDAHLTERVRGLSLCMSGVDRLDQMASLSSRFQAEFPYAKVEVVNDALAALTAGTRGTSGVVVIAGTGSIAAGESWRGRTARAGGYGNLIGDEGSGFDIGRRGIMAAIQYAEHRGPSTQLWDVAQEVFRVREPQEIIPRIYDSVHSIGAVASFARHVLEAVSQDAVALEIVKESARAFVGMTVSVREQLAEEVSNRIVLAGGLFTHTAVLRDAFDSSLRRVWPGVVCEPLTERPSSGAVLRALRAVHQEKMAISKWQQVMAGARRVGR